MQLELSLHCTLAVRHTCVTTFNNSKLQLLLYNASACVALQKGTWPLWLHCQLRGTVGLVVRVHKRPALLLAAVGFHDLEWCRVFGGLLCGKLCQAVAIAAYSLCKRLMYIMAFRHDATHDGIVPERGLLSRPWSFNASCKQLCLTK